MQSEYGVDPRAVLVGGSTTHDSALETLREINASSASAQTKFAHRVMCFQQMLVNSVQDVLDRSVDAASRRNPTAFSDPVIG